MGELAVDHESGALRGPHHQPSTSESPANATAGAWVPAELDAASGEPPVDSHGVGQLRLHGYPRIRQIILDRLRALETLTGQTLLMPAELDVIHDVWRRDRIREDGRLALLACVGVIPENVPA